MLCDIQSVWPRIWTRVAVSISYDDNHYTTGTFFTPRAPPREVESIALWFYWTIIRNVRDDISDVKSTIDVWKYKIQKPQGKFVKQEKYGRLISESAFVVLNYIIWLIRNFVKNLKKQTVTTTRYDLSSLTNRNIHNKYTATIRNKFDSFLDTYKRYTPNMLIYQPLRSGWIIHEVNF